jgi:predicted ester cyclase
MRENVSEIPPTGKAVAVRGITICRIVDGKVKTEWTEYDRLGLLRQLGVVPS